MAEEAHKTFLTFDDIKLGLDAKNIH